MDDTAANEYSPALFAHQPPQLAAPGRRHPMVSGFCHACGTEHSLPSRAAVAYCRQLMEHLHKHATIDLTPTATPDPLLSTAPLFGEARGKMFGVLVCTRPEGGTVALRAFSGQYNGLWEVEGWVPPLFDTTAFRQTNDHTEREIKSLGGELARHQPHSTSWLSIKSRRRRLSRQLMREIHDLYRLTNFHGHTASLADAFAGKGGIATGTGDCCAPKLLGYAAAKRLTPVALAEFYWGRENRSGSRRHEYFYPPCEQKCEPILGFLLCGLATNHHLFSHNEPTL